MPRRRALTTAQLDELFALPTELNTLVRYWTLAGTDLAAIHRRRRDRNRLGFALQLCALRYPGRLLGPGELIPAEALRTDFGFADFTLQHRREILVWLMPIALATTSAATIAATLMDEVRRLFRLRRKAVRCSGDSDAIELAVNAVPEGLLFCVDILILDDRRFLPAHPGFRGRDTRVI